MYGVTAKGAGSCGDNNHWLSNHGCHGWTCCDHPNRFHVCVKSKTVKPAEPPRLCCLAMTADCLACSENMSVEEYCDLNPATAGCRFVKCPPLSCRMLCEHGYVQDKNGCDTCECITDEVEVCPERCISWYDGCNECKCEDGEATFCTEKGCSLMEEAYCMKYEEEEEVCPEGCKTWHDGCNNCGCEGGEVTFCTLMGCSFKGDPYCAEYHEPDQGEVEHCPEGCKTWYDGCNMCNCHSAMGPICTQKGCSVMEEAYCMEYGEPGPYEIPCITFFCDTDHGCDVVGADERGCGGICMCPEDPKEPCVAPLCEIGCDLVGADERGCGGECICAIVTEEPKEPCIATLCEIGCDLVGADERGCGGDCICPSTKPKCHTWNQRDGYYVQEGHGVETDCYPALDEAKTACLNTNGDCFAIATQSNWCEGQYRVTQGGPTFSDFFDDWETYGLRSWELVTNCVKPTPPTVRVCCLAETADCLACSENMSVEDFCKMHPETAGCLKPTEPPRPCCHAETADCLACGENISVEEYCDLNPATAGCQNAAIVLILNGENPMKITQGDLFVDPGAFADGGEDIAIATASNVNTRVPGRYRVQYDAYDSAGNYAGTAEREVYVTATTTTTAATRPLKVRKSGETCGYVFGIGNVGDCVDGLTCACVGACADPMIADAPSSCIRTETVPCANGEECGTACHLDKSWMGNGVCDGMV